MDELASSNTASQVHAGQDIVFKGQGPANINAKVSADKTVVEEKKSGVMSRSSQRQEIDQPSVTKARLQAGRKILFKTQSANLEGVDIVTPEMVNATTDGMTVGPAIGIVRQQVDGSSSGWTGRTNTTIDKGEEIAIPTLLEVDKIVSTTSKLKRIVTDTDPGRTLPLTVEGAYEETIRHLEKWNHEKVESSWWSKPMMAAVGIGITWATWGWGASAAQALYLSGTTMGTMVSAGVTGLASMAGTTLVANNGDFEATLNSLASSDSVKSLAAQVASAGILKEFNIINPTEYASFGELAEYSALKTGVNTGLNVAMGRGEALQNAGVNFLVTLGGSYGAQEIGRLYGGLTPDGEVDPSGPKLGYIGHKLLHGMLGGAIGAVRGDALAGAIGALAAELIADTIQEDPAVVYARAEQKAAELGIDPDSSAFDQILLDEARPVLDFSRVGGAIAVALAGHDVDVGLEAATNAVENNSLKLLTALANMAKTALKQGAKEGSKKATKETAKQGAKSSVKKQAKEKAKEGFSEETKNLLGETNKYKKELFERAGKSKDRSTLRAAQKELKGEQIELAKQRGREYDHVRKVEQAQDGLDRHIKALKNRLGFPKLPEIERQALEKELSKASKLLDHAEKFVPRK